MSLLFNGTSQSISRTTSPLSGSYPYTICLRFWPTDSTPTADSYIFSCGKNGDLTAYIAILNAIAGSLKVAALSSGQTRVHEVTGVLNAAWNTAVMVATTSSNIIGYLNGASGSTITSQVPIPAALDRCTIGALGRTSIANWFGGKVAEVGIYGVAWAASDIAAYNDGFCPLDIQRPQLINYWQLYSSFSPAPDYVGGLDMTLNSAPTQDDHPNLVYFQRRIGARKVATGGGGTITGTGAIIAGQTIGGTAGASRARVQGGM